MDNSDEPEDLLDGKIVFQKNKDRTFSKTKVICTLCEKTLSFHRSNTRLTTATRSMCCSARGVQVECAKPDSLAGHIVQKKRFFTCGQVLLSILRVQTMAKRHKWEARRENQCRRLRRAPY
ncbi:unnamed protein product [Pleuronectes platessa]|uniref:Uncharacterized protein n=1 Tax=Pleuronectes platessa TaxID=8262 RepID=A0A9N7VUJ0_PLEPL|nr:unnamed protein product [Pleuronectes platessa]